jgi:ADP-heptose:LPS heptosyltransferase
MKILLLLPNNLGDVIMTTPVLEGLKAKYPRSHIAFFVEQGFEGGLEHNPHCDELILFPRRKIRDLLFFSPCIEGAEDIQKILADLNQRSFDVVINLCQHHYVSYLMALISGKNKIGQCFLRDGNHSIADDWSSYLYAIPFARRCNSLHAIDVYRRISGATAHRGGCTIHLTDEEKNGAREYLAARGIAPESRTMILQPGAAYPSKRWPVDAFISLGKMLSREGWNLVITGAPAEAELARGVAQGLEGPAVMSAGDLTFRQTIALCGRAQGCITGDSALMHAAAALDIPAYALFGPTSPVETGPYGNGHWIFSAHCPTRPCFEFECKTLLCLKSILPETVFSCIKNGNPGAKSGCDVFRTILTHGCDYEVAPVHGDLSGYVNQSAAWLTRKAFNDPVASGIKPREDENSQETRDFLSVLTGMSARLNRFLGIHDAKAISDFEACKAELEKFKGIGAFWTAILNLRLNSVPLLDPIKGVRESLRACLRTEDQIRNALR